MTVTRPTLFAREGKLWLTSPLTGEDCEIRFGEAAVRHCLPMRSEGTDSATLTAIVQCDDSYLYVVRAQGGRCEVLSRTEFVCMNWDVLRLVYVQDTTRPDDDRSYPWLVAASYRGGIVYLFRVDLQGKQRDTNQALYNVDSVEVEGDTVIVRGGGSLTTVLLCPHHCAVGVGVWRDV